MLQETMQFWSELLKPYQPQSWTMESQIVFENRSLTLRLFTSHPSAKIPILILAPNAGHHQNISEPLMTKALAVDPERPVYVVDWKEASADSENRFDSIGDIVSNVGECVRRIGGKVHLFTLCQGAWVGAIYTALNPETVVSYVDAAGPIDFTAGGGKLQDICKNLPMSFYEGMVASGGGIQKGEYQLLGFKALNPYDRYVGDYLELWNAVCEGSEAKIEKWRRFKSWYDQPIDLAGKWYLEAVEKLFKQNLLITGELEILGRKVNLANIKCPVHLIAGENDDITLPEQVFNAEKYVSGPVTKKIIPGAGHIGVFVKSDSLKYWETAILKNLDKIEQISLVS